MKSLITRRSDKRAGGPTSVRQSRHSYHVIIIKRVGFNVADSAFFTTFKCLNCRTLVGPALITHNMLPFSLELQVASGPKYYTSIVNNRGRGYSGHCSANVLTSCRFSSHFVSKTYPSFKMRLTLIYTKLYDYIHCTNQPRPLITDEHAACDMYQT